MNDRSSGATERSYAMTLVFVAATPASALSIILALNLDATFVAVGFGAVAAACWWQLIRWQAVIGHRTLSRVFVSDAATMLDVPRSLVWLLVAAFFIVLAVVVPAFAIVGIAL